MYKSAYNLCSKPVTNWESKHKQVPITHENIKLKKTFYTFAVNVSIKLTIMLYSNKPFSKLNKQQSLIESHKWSKNLFSFFPPFPNSSVFFPNFNFIPFMGFADPGSKLYALFGLLFCL